MRYIYIKVMYIHEIYSNIFALENYFRVSTFNEFYRSDTPWKIVRMSSPKFFALATMIMFSDLPTTITIHFDKSHSPCCYLLPDVFSSPLFHASLKLPRGNLNLSFVPGR